MNGFALRVKRRTQLMKNKMILAAALFLLFSGCSDGIEYEFSEGSLSIEESKNAEENGSLQQGEEDTDEASSEVLNADEEADGTMLCVYVCGEVKSPGIYMLKEGSRVYEAIEAAGGLLEGVDETGINMAAQLYDGQQITVSLDGAETAGESAASNNGSGKVNLNTADAEELMTLSGIGEARAADIISYREEYGYFSSIEEIMNVSGIGEKMFEKIKDDIKV